MEYSALNAKIRSWFGALLNAERTEALILSDYSGVIEYIRNNETRGKFSSDDIIQIEWVLKQELMEYCRSALKYIGGSAAHFISEWLRIYEIDNLKLIVRSVLTGNSVNYLYQTHKLGGITAESLREVKTLEDFRELLRGTEYYKISESVFPRVVEEQSPFYWEMYLDNYYARNLKTAASKLNMDGKKSVHGIIFRQMEVNRIIWMFRLRFIYKLGVEEVLANVPNILSVITSAQYHTLLDSTSEEEFFQNLTKLKMIEKPVNSAIEMEKELNRDLLKKVKKFSGGIPFTMGVTLCFLVLKTINIRNYIVLLEGKKAGISKEKISSMLI